MARRNDSKTAVASCSASYGALRRGRQIHTRFSGKKKAPLKGLFRLAIRSVLASPEATTRIGTVNAIEITVYSYMVIVKQKLGTGLNAKNDRAQAQRTTPLSCLPINSKTAFVSILVPNMSRGRFNPSPCTGELIHFAAATVSFSYRERASSNTATNATWRSLSAVFKRPVFALRANIGDTASFGTLCASEHLHL